MGHVVGDPDIVHVEGGRVWAFELKADGGKTTAIQEHRLGQWRAAGATVAVVRSLDDVKKRLQACP